MSDSTLGEAITGGFRNLPAFCAGNNDLMGKTFKRTRSIAALCILCILVSFGCKGGVAAQHFALIKINDFGSNPGAVRMFVYIPSSQRPAPALVVAMHGCAQNAQDFANHSGWPELANRLGFVLIFPQQALTNNPAGCFNWFLPKNSTCGSGEVLSIEQMVERIKRDHPIDAKRVYVTGLSAGGAMTSVMLATYPEVFAGGAIMSGVPYGCATTLSGAVTCMRSSVKRTPQEWSALIRQASAATSWPRVSIWQGTADKVIAPINADEEMAQWTDLHSIAQTAAKTDVVNSYTHQVFSAADGKPVVEVYSITNMGHGQAIDPGTGFDQCGVTEAFFPNAHICAAYYAAKFWGLDRPDGQRRLPSIARIESTKPYSAESMIDSAFHRCCER